MPDIRPVRPEDLDALHDICLKTGDNGADGTHLYKDHRIIGEIFAAPYGLLQPDYAFVAEDEEGVCGYIMGTPDTRAFEARLEREWWPALRQRYADTAHIPGAERNRDQWDAFLIHHPPIVPQAIVDKAAAHLHIDLLPRAQGRGVGKALMDRWLGHAGGKAHLGCQEPNRRAQHFYERYGWKRVEGVGPRTVVWMTFGV